MSRSVLSKYFSSTLVDKAPRTYRQCLKSDKFSSTCLGLFASCYQSLPFFHKTSHIAESVVGKLLHKTLHNFLSHEPEIT